MQDVEIKNVADLCKDENINSLLKKLSIFRPYNDSRNHLKVFFESLRDDLQVVIEYGYVDVMYRNEYYSFYSSKLKEHSRNCAKLSFFEPDSINGVDAEGMLDYSTETISKIKSGFLGFLVLRPITACIGRNVISIKAKKSDYVKDICFCKTKIETSVLGVEVAVEGFPHASQDGEMIVCAETAIWSFCEYYGNKYPTHSTTLPSGVLNALSPVSNQRQIPSSGLYLNQVSSALKNLGLSPRVYNLYDENSECMNEEIKEVLATYIESGFPVVACLQSRSLAHADICIGRTNKIDDLKRREVLYQYKSSIMVKSLYWYNSSVNEFVFCDDNLPCYQIARLDSPTSYYKANGIDGMENFKLVQFIVHLPCKVYNEAQTALRLIKDFVNKYAYNGTVSRVLLASSRSLRNHLSTSEVLGKEWKNLLIGLSLPRYVWICEMSCDIDEFNRGFVSGLVLMDATAKENSFILYIEQEQFCIDGRPKPEKGMKVPFLMGKYNCK